MLKSCLKIAWRNIIKNRIFSVIKIVGLSFLVAFCLLLFFFIRHEQSYNAFHSIKVHLFRMEMSNLFPSGDTARKKSVFSFLIKNDDVKNQFTFSFVIDKNIKNAFPELRSVACFKDNRNKSIKKGNRAGRKQHVLFADSNFAIKYSEQL